MESHRTSAAPNKGIVVLVAVTLLLVLITVWLRSRSAFVAYSVELPVMLTLFAGYIAFGLGSFCIYSSQRDGLREFLFWGLGLLTFAGLQILSAGSLPGGHSLQFFRASFDASTGFGILAALLLSIYFAIGASRLRAVAFPKSVLWLLSAAFVVAAAFFFTSPQSTPDFYDTMPSAEKRLLSALPIVFYILAGASLIVHARRTHREWPLWLLVALLVAIFMHVAALSWQRPLDAFFQAEGVSGILFLSLLSAGILRYRSHVLGTDRGLSFSLSNESYFSLGKRSALETIENLPNGVVIADAGGALRFANRAFRKMMDYSQANIAGLHISVFFDTTNYEKLLALTVGKDQPQTGCELELLSNDNRKLPVSVDIMPLKNGSGKVVGTQFVVSSRTAQKQLEGEWREQLLEKSRQLETLQQCIENATEGILIIDEKTVIRQVNRAFEKMSGFEREHLIGQKTNILIDGPRSEFIHEKIWDILKDGRLWRGDFNTRKKDGSSFLGEVSVVEIRANNNSERKYLWMERDISRSKALETSLQNYAERLTSKTEELEASRAYYESLISGMSDILIVVDNDGQCLFLNDYGQKRLGFNAPDLSKEKLPVFFDDLKKLEKDYGSAIQVEIKNFEAAIKPKSGDPILCSWYAKPLLDRFGRRTGAMAVGRDISQYKSLENKLQDHARTLERSVLERTTELESKVNQLGKLLEIGEEILLNVDVDVIINRVCEAIQSLRWHKVVVSLRDVEGKTSRPVATAGLTSEEVSRVMQWGAIPYEQTERYFKERFRMSHSYFVPHEEELITPETQYTIYNDLGERAKEEWHALDALLVPIRTRDKILGVISVDDPSDRRRPDLDGVRDLEIFADKAALAIENARLIQGQKENEREAKFLAAIGKIFHASLNLEEVIEAVVQKGALAIGEFCSLLLLDDRNELLVPQATYHNNPGIVEYFLEGTQKHPCLAGEGIVGSVVKTGKACLLSRPFSEENDLTQAPFYYLQKFHSISSLMVIPLKVRGKTLGAMLYLLFDMRRKYRNDELRLAQELADRAALAVENARLFTEAGEKAAELEKASKLKSEFLANVSHELRTPLNAIITLSDILIRSLGADEDSEQIKQMQIIQRSGKNLLNLINDILDLSKIESGGVQAVYSEVPIRSVVEETIEHIRPLCLKKNLKLEYEFAKNVPETVVTDQDKVTKALTNILSNAVKFTKTGGISVHMSMAERKQIQIDVQDTGIGIPKDRQDEIFKEFQQIDSTDERNYGGTGLGLAITKRVLEIIEGTVSVKSQQGKGSTFTISFPIKSKKDVALDTNDYQLRQPAFEPTFGLDVTDDRHNLKPDKKTVLVIDDEKDSQYVIAHYLRDNDYQIILPNNGEDPVQLASDFMPFAITLDIIMAGRSGWDILQSLKADDTTKDIPVIVTTILSERERAMELGADAYLTKPFEEGKLIDYLSAAEKNIEQNADRKGRFAWQKIFSKKRKQDAVKGTNGNHKGAKILLVDDDQDTQYSIQLILEGAGYEVFCANDGKEALDKVDEIQPDLILMDIMMPGMNGYETTRAMREKENLKTTPILAVTAKAMKGDREKTIEAGCDDYIAKPFGAQEIIAVVNKWLELSESAPTESAS